MNSSGIICLPVSSIEKVQASVQFRSVQRPSQVLLDGDAMLLPKQRVHTLSFGLSASLKKVVDVLGAPIKNTVGCGRQRLSVDAFGTGASGALRTLPDGCRTPHFIPETSR